jgi:hypothetical protein
MSERGRMTLGLVLPIGMGGLGDGRTARWTDLRAIFHLEARGVAERFAALDPPGARGIAAFAPVLDALRG